MTAGGLVIDVLHQQRLCRRAIDTPQLGAILAVIGAQEKPKRCRGKPGNGCTARPWMNLFEHLRAGRRTVTPPEFDTMYAIVGTEKELSLKENKCKFGQLRKG